MQKKFPAPPFPTFGELIFDLATRSNLVQSNEEDRSLYESLKAFKDERKRPGLSHLDYPVKVVEKLQRRLAKFIRSPEQARGIIQVAEEFRFAYLAANVRHDMTLFDREKTVYILWATVFPAWAAFMLTSLQRLFPGVDITPLLRSKNPLAYHLNQLCPPGSKVTLVCEHRAKKHGIDIENGRKTVHSWLKGEATPGLDNLQDFLEALGHGESTGHLVWIFTARLLEKTEQDYRNAIHNWLGLSKKENPYEHFWKVKNSWGMKIGKELNIGMDRPYVKILKALYEPSEPRSEAYVVGLIERLEKTWEPIREDTLGTVLRLRARLLVLTGHLQEAFELYLESYENGMGRDPDAYKITLDEALSVAGKLKKSKEVKRFHQLLQLYWKTEWDGRDSTLLEHFERMFPSELHY